MATLLNYAAPFEYEDNDENDNNIPKKMNKNRTLKSNKITKDNLKDKINNTKFSNKNNDYDDDDDDLSSNEEDELNNFKPVQVELQNNYVQNYSKLFENSKNQNYQNYQNYKNYKNYENNDKNELLKKLDNILHILEEQQEEKSNYLVEELILYIFLGIFIIYVLDSFVRVGKYTR